MFRARAQVDAIAACPWGAIRQEAEEGIVSGAYVFAHDKPALITVAYSYLEGNYWGGGVALVDARSDSQCGWEQVCGFQYDSGITSVVWCGEKSNLLACACDNGDIEVLRLSSDVEFAFHPVGSGSGVGGKWTQKVTHADVVTGISKSPFDSTRLTSCSWDQSVKVWDLNELTAAQVTLQDGHTNLVWCVAWSPWTPSILSSGSQDSTTQLWDERVASMNANILTLRSSSPVLALDWHPHQETIISVGLEDGTLSTFDIRKSSNPLFEQALHDRPIHALRYSPFHMDLVATASDDATIRATDRSQAASTMRISSSVVAHHRDYVRGLDWYASTRNRLCEKQVFLVSGSWDKTVRNHPIEIFPSSQPPGF
uniref:Methylosome protein 50 putative n=1 Tax=Albugo laibachii Nc14 TaxID=890382 RepID=F0WVC6_9STRA|nr:methylosome protein 50 putative [Albugo laibachii Nc14]|eukprot:CCA25365.1 methylosome protein 50 putative [Albugo laibachii Nc14]